MSMPRVLVVDDKKNFLKLFREILGADFEVVTAADGCEALELLASSRFDVVVSDVRMPGADGFAVLRAARGLPTEVVLVTAYGSIPRAVEAMRLGAFDYLTKPFDPDDALAVVQRALASRRGSSDPQHESLPAPVESFCGMVGSSDVMQDVFALVRKAARSNATVLITGESGTGKELVARAVHKCANMTGAFVAVNCGAIPVHLVESELFGHEKGAFTGATSERAGLIEAAQEGTLFLDEVVDLPAEMQVKLNRVLQEHTVRRVGDTRERALSVRVLAAANVDLKRAVSDGLFREDLFYRLNVLAIELPPLRERRADIPALALRFLRNHGGNEEFSVEALGLLGAYHWPGNVRELENVVARAVACADSAILDVDTLVPEIRQDSNKEQADESRLLDLSYRETIDDGRERLSQRYLLTLLQRYAGNVTQAAKHAGMERESLHRLLKRHAISPDDFRQ